MSTLKDMVKGVVTLAKEHMVITAVTCSLVVGGACVGGVVAYNHAHADNNKVESATETSARDSSYKKLKERYQAVKSVIGELILDEEMSAKLTSDAEEIRAYIENSNSKSVEDDMLKKMKELEENVNKETNNSIKKLAEKEAEVAKLVATTNAPKFADTSEDSTEAASTENTEVVTLDDATLSAYDAMKKDYDSFKAENKYKSANEKCDKIIELISTFKSADADGGETTDADANAGTDSNTAADNSGSSTGNTASSNGGSNFSGDKNSGSNGSGSNKSSGSGNGNSQTSSNKPSQSQTPAQQPSQPQTPAEQPSNNKAGVAETFYDGSVGRGISAEEKAHIDGLVNSWLNGGYTNEGLQYAILDYLMEKGYTVNGVTALKNSIKFIPSGKTYTLESVMTGSELYYYGKCWTDGEASGDGRVGYYSVVDVF